MRKCLVGFSIRLQQGSQFPPQLGDFVRTPPPVRPGAVGHDHDVARHGPVSPLEGPFEPPLLVMALEEDHVAPLAEAEDEVGLEIAQAAVHRVRLDHDGEGADRLEEVEEALVAVAHAPGVAVLVEPEIGRAHV